MFTSLSFLLLFIQCGSYDLPCCFSLFTILYLLWIPSLFDNKKTIHRTSLIFFPIDSSHLYTFTYLYIYIYLLMYSHHIKSILSPLNAFIVQRYFFLCYVFFFLFFQMRPFEDFKLLKEGQLEHYNHL